jgi:hypothetical protein
VVDVVIMAGGVTCVDAYITTVVVLCMGLGFPLRMEFFLWMILKHLSFPF